MKAFSDDLSHFISSHYYFQSFLQVSRLESDIFNVSDMNDFWEQISYLLASQGDLLQDIRQANEMFYDVLSLSSVYRTQVTQVDSYFLHKVLLSGAGHPVALCLVFQSICQKLKLQTRIATVPKHTFVKIMGDQGTFYVQPGKERKIYNENEFNLQYLCLKETATQNKRVIYKEWSLDDTIKILLKKIKQAFILKADIAGALKAVEVLAELSPNSPELMRDRGVLYCEMEYYTKAKSDLFFYLKKRPKADDYTEIKKLANMLNDQAISMH